MSKGDVAGYLSIGLFLLGWVFFIWWCVATLLGGPNG